MKKFIPAFIFLMFPLLTHANVAPIPIWFGVLIYASPLLILGIITLLLHFIFGKKKIWLGFVAYIIIGIIIYFLMNPPLFNFQDFLKIISLWPMILFLW